MPDEQFSLSRMAWEKSRRYSDGLSYSGGDAARDEESRE
jgi:hypothetical protein